VLSLLPRRRFERNPEEFLRVFARLRHGGYGMSEERSREREGEVAMKRLFYRRVGCLALLTLWVGNVATAATESAQGGALALSEAAKANPELVGELSKELGSTPDQAAGAAGALFAVAKSRLNADEFSQVSKAVPGMGALLKAAPVAAVGTSGTVSQLAGSAAGLAAAASAFSKLGLKPELVTKAVPILTSFVTKSGGANVGKLLAGALK
jgi:Protein of unknown function VcgC/VcgE (DUF2780)